ncbi:MAG: hypothetical protein Q8L27_02220 [archaeon]|nr:hypothetical protein [archaeon]
MVKSKGVQIEESIQKQKNIPLILDSYDEIFSDFDPRSSSERALSDDFVRECNHAARDKTFGKKIELILSLPKPKRKPSEEVIIKKRLLDHFRKHFLLKEKERKSIVKKGLYWVFIGITLLFTNTFIRTYSPSFLLNMLSLIMEPASWFSFWEGLGKIFIHSKESVLDYDFYKKMANLEVTFKGY